MSLPKSAFKNDDEIQRFLKWLHSYYPKKNAELLALALSGDGAVVEFVTTLLEEFRKNPGLPLDLQN